MDKDDDASSRGGLRVLEEGLFYGIDIKRGQIPEIQRDWNHLANIKARSHDGRRY